MKVGQRLGIADIPVLNTTSPATELPPRRLTVEGDAVLEPAWRERTCRMDSAFMSVSC
jgi:hypothetical protein